MAAGSDFVRIDRQALGLALETTRTRQDGATFFDVTLRDATGKDRAVTLVLHGPRRGRRASAGSTTRGERRRSRPAASTSTPRRSVPARTAGSRPIRWRRGSRPPGPGLALGIDMAHPAFYRIGYNAGTGELFVAYDIGLTTEKPSARLRFCRFDFDPAWGFRAALAAYYRALPRRLPLPHRRARALDAVRQDQPGRGLGGFRLQVQGGQRRDRLGRRARRSSPSATPSR